MDGDRIEGLLEEDAVAPNAEAKEALEFAGQRLDATRTGFGITVDGFENRYGDVLRDGADPDRTSGSKRSASLFLIGPVDLLHGETEIGGDLLEGNALAPLAKVLVGSMEGPAIFLGQFLVLVIDHDFEQMNDGGELPGPRWPSSSWALASSLSTAMAFSLV